MSVLETVEKQNPQGSRPILIVDKEGYIGEKLSEKLKPFSLVVFVSKIIPQSNDEGILHVAYKKPQSIPDAQYSHIFVVLPRIREGKEFLLNFIKESKKRSAKLIVIAPLRGEAAEAIGSELKKYEDELLLLHVGDLFSKDQIPSFLDELLDKAVAEKQITFSGMGLAQIYPVELDDTVDAVLEAAFSLSNKSETYFLFPKASMNLLSLARTIQGVDPFVRVDFKNNPDIEEAIDLTKGSFMFGGDYNSTQKIKDALSARTSGNIRRVVRYLKPENSSLKANILHFVISTLLLIFLLPVFLTAFFSALGVFQLKLAKNALEEGTIASSVSHADRASGLFSLSHNFLQTVSLEMSPIGLSDQLLFFNKTIENVYDLSLLLSSFSKAAQSYQNILLGTSANSQKDSDKAQQELKNTLLIYEKLKASGFLGIAQQDIVKLTFLGNILINTQEIIPQMLGVGGNKTYLILFQNNMELRPGGGFIGSYGILKLEKGKVAQFLIHDVYDADGQLKGHVEPPYPIRRYIPMVHWYLRDSNFDVDFPTNAKNAAFFLQEELGEQIDGVLAVDITFIKNILHAAGPLYISDYNETVDASNLYLVTQKHAEKNFFPGSTQKKDFLRSLALSLENKLTLGKKVSYASLLDALSQSIEEKHVLFAVSQESVQNVLSVSNLSSSLFAKQQVKENEVSDFFGVNEANLGVNKANYFIKRKVAKETTLNQDSVSSKVTLSYTNDSKDWPGGDYKVYIRVIVPKDANLKAISIDQKQMDITSAITDFLMYEDKSFQQPKGLEVDRYQEAGKTIFGFLTIVPKNSHQAIELSYDFPITLSGDSFFYNLDIFKQPGTEAYQEDIAVSSNSSAFLKPTEFKQNGAELSSKKVLVKDENYRFGFSKTQ